MNSCSSDYVPSSIDFSDSNNQIDNLEQDDDSDNFTTKLMKRQLDRSYDFEENKAKIQKTKNKKMQYNVMKHKKNVVTFYAHKGGVGKTTCLLTMVVKAIQDNKKILIIDGDPQMNTTHFLLEKYDPNIFDYLYNSFLCNYLVIKKEEKLRTELEKSHVEKYNTSIRSKNLFDLLHDFDPTNANLECNDLDIDNIGYDIKILENNDTLIKLITAHPMLNDIEQYFVKEMLDIRAPKPYTRKFQFLCNYLTNKYEFDMIFVDLNPSSSYLNQNLIMQSDFLILPCVADAYSYHAIKTIGIRLKFWLESNPSNLSPKILCTVYNKYKTGSQDNPIVMNDSEYYPTSAHKDYINKFKKTIKEMKENVEYSELFLDIDYDNFPLIKDSLTPFAKMQSNFETCYNSKIKDTKIESLKFEYNVLWNKLCLILLGELKNSQLPGSFHTEKRERRKSKEINLMKIN